MATVAQKLITADEFILMPDPADGSKQELVRGEIISMAPPGFRHGIYQFRVARLLDAVAAAHNLGRVTVETGLVTERDPDTVRGPDVAFWSYERLPADQVPVGYPEVAADLCVEVLSPSDRPGQLREKVREYFARGVRMVWLIDPDDRTVWVYRGPGEARVFHDDVALTGEDILPGFTCPVAELFG